MTTDKGDLVTAIVLCGGTSRRLGGGDKTAADIAGVPLLDHLIAALPPTWSLVCVGAPRPLSRDVRWTHEDPPLGGPVAGLAAGLAHASTPYVVLLAGDQPFAGEAAPQLVDALRAAPADVQGARALDAQGSPQPLLAAYRTADLRAVAPVGEAARDRAVRRTLAPLRCVDLPVAAHVAWDVDTPDDLARARRHASVAGGTTAETVDIIDRAGATEAGTVTD